MSGSDVPTIRSVFSASVIPKSKRRPPVSIRFSDDELEQLRSWADDRPLGAVVRERLFGANAKKGRKVASPPRQRKAIAGALRRLGQSQIAAYLTSQITALEEGRLMLSTSEEQQLRDADRECYLIRGDLVKALGIDADHGESTSP
ncbi:MAG: hypothetical protein AAF739_01345 [Pseudomonadota bacterium]